MLLPCHLSDTLNSFSETTRYRNPSGAAITQALVHSSSFFFFFGREKREERESAQIEIGGDFPFKRRSCPFYYIVSPSYLIVGYFIRLRHVPLLFLLLLFFFFP